MQITPVGYTTNPNKRQNTLNIHSVNFKRKTLSGIKPSSFQKESSKKLYSAIKQYLERVGNYGNVKDRPIMRDIWQSPDPTIIINDSFTKEADILLSIDKTDKTTKICLARKLPDTTNKSTFFEALFDEKGQMVLGSFNSGRLLQFERYGKNIRRILYMDREYVPDKNNDKRWLLNGGDLYSSHTDAPIKEDNSAGGAFEIFIEFARKYTSIHK